MSVIESQEIVPDKRTKRQIEWQITGYKPAAKNQMGSNRG
jgi:hypothetical protein